MRKWGKEGRGKESGQRGSVKVVYKVSDDDDDKERGVNKEKSDDTF